VRFALCGAGRLPPGQRSKPPWIFLLRIAIVFGGHNVRISQRPLLTSGVSSMVPIDMTRNDSMTILAATTLAAPVSCWHSPARDERFDDQALAERCAS
jgi:hypothetical protein